MHHLFIFPIADIDSIILHHLDLQSLFNVAQLNKYYYKFINNLDLICELKKFYEITKICVFNSPTILFIKVLDYKLLNSADYFIKNLNLDLDFLFRFYGIHQKLENAQLISKFSSKYYIKKEQEGFTWCINH